MDFIYDLLDDLYAEIAETQREVAQKGLTRECLNDVDKLAHAAKCLETIMAMKDSGSYREGRSYNNYMDSYGNYGNYRDNSSYGNNYGARRRDSMGRFRDRSGRYSDSEKENLKNQLNQMMEQSSDEKEREAIRYIMKRMEK